MTADSATEGLRLAQSMRDAEDYEARKKEQHRRATMTPDEVEAEFGRESRLMVEVMRPNARGRPRDGYPARWELVSIRVRRKIAARGRGWRR